MTLIFFYVLKREWHFLPTKHLVSHAEQAVEKALKSWLSLAGVQYPKIHDLEKLFSMLEESGESVSSEFWNLLDLTDFAVQFRYETLEEDFEKLDRASLLNQVEKLLQHVSGLIDTAG
jgi:HEPN domain-containing protein